MATIDELSIEVQSSAKKVDNSIDKAAKQLEHLASATSKVSASKLNSISVGLKNISNSLRGLKDATSAIKSLQGISNISSATKGLEKVKKSADGLKDIKADIDTKDFDSAVREFQDRFKDVEMDFTFSGSTDEIEKEIKSLEISLDGLLKKQDKMRAIGTNTNSKSFIGLQYDISATVNKLQILEEELRKVKSSASEIKIQKSTPDISLDYYTKSLQEYKGLIKDLEQTYKGLPNIPKDALDIPIENIKTDIEDIKVLFPEATKELSALEKELKNFQAIASGLTREPVDIKIDTNASEKVKDISESVNDIKKSMKAAGLTAEQFEEYLENIQIPDIRTDNLKKLRTELERTEKKLDELTTKSDNWTAKGVNPDSEKFRNLQEQIVATSKKSDALQKKIKEVSETKPNVSGWQKLTDIASTIDKVFGAIKRGVSSALSSIKKLGKGFQNLGSVVKKVSSAIGKMFSNIVQLASKATNAITSSVKSMTNAFSKLRGESSGIQRASSGLSGLAKTAGSLLAVKGVADFGKSAIELGSNITEVENVVDTAFGSMAGKVYEFASTASEQFGLSELAAKQYSGTMMAMLKSSGVAQGAASDMSITLAGLAGDLASFYNIETDEAFRKLRAGISGETEPLKQLGINMNIVNLEAYAMANGINKAYKEMTLAEQTMLRYNYIIAKTGDAQGDFARTAGTWANQLRLLRLNIQSIAAIIGQGLIAALLPAIKLLNKFMSKLTEAAKKFRDFMYVLFGKKIEAPARGVVDDMAGSVDYTEDLSGIGESAEDVADGMEDAADGTDSLTESTKKLKKALSVLPFDQLNQLTGNPEDLDSSSKKDKDKKDKDKELDDLGLGDMSDMFDDLYDKSEIEPVNEWARRLREAFLNHDWEGLGKIIAEMVNTGLKKIYDGIKKITPKVEKALRAFAKVFNSFVKWLDWDLLGRTIGAGINLLARAFNALFGPGGIDLEQLGRKLSVGLRGMIDEVDWRGLGNAIGNYFMIAWRIASGFVEDMWRINPDTLLTGWAEVGIALADAVHGIFERINFAQIGKTLADGFDGITEIIRNFRNRMADNGTWSMIAMNISDGLNNLFEVDLVGFAQQASGLALDILYMLNDAAERTNWNDFGYKIADALFSIQWLTLFNQVFDLVSATFGEALGGFVNYMTTHAEQLGQSFADVFNTLFAKIQYIASNIPWDDLGTAISTFLNTAIAKIRPGQAAVSLGNFVTSLLGTMLQVAEKTRWDDLGRKIGNFLMMIPWQTIIGQVFDTITAVFGGLITGLGGKILDMLPSVGTALANGFNHAFETLKEFLDGMEGKWKEAGLSIATGLNNMISGIDWKEAGETFGRFVKGVIDVIFTVAMNTDWVGFARGIGDFLDGIPWLEILSKVASTIGVVVGEVIAGLFETTSGKFLLGFAGLKLLIKGVNLGNTALEIVDDFAHKFGLLPDGVNLTVPKLLESITKITGKDGEGGVFSKIISAAKDVVSKVGEKLGFLPKSVTDTIPGISGGVEKIAGGAGLFSKILGGASGLVSKIGPILGTIGSVIFSPKGLMIAGIVAGVAVIIANWDSIKKAAGEIWGAIKTAVTDVWEGLKTAAGDIWGGIKTVITDTWDGIKTGASDIWDGVKTYLSDVWNGIQTMAGDAWSGITTVVSDAWDGVTVVTHDTWDALTTFLGDTWDGLKTMAGDTWEGIKTGASDIWGGLKTMAGDIWGAITGNVSDANASAESDTATSWSNAKESMNANLQAMATAAQSAMESIKATVNASMAEITATYTSQWQAIAGATKGVLQQTQTEVTVMMQSIKMMIATSMQEIGAIFNSGWQAINLTSATAVEQITSNVNTKMSAMQSAIGSSMQQIAGIFQNSWSAIGGMSLAATTKMQADVTSKMNAMLNAVNTSMKAITNAYNSGWKTAENATASALSRMQNVVSSKMNAIKSVIASTMNGVQSTFQTKWNAIGNVATQALAKMHSTVTSKMNAVKSTINTAMTSVYNTFKTKWDSVGNACSQALNKMQSTVSSKMSAIKNTVSNSMNSIVSSYQNGMNKLPNITTNTLTRVVNEFNRIPNRIGSSLNNNMLTAGKNAAISFANGIKSIHIPTPHIRVASWTQHRAGDSTYSTPNFGVNWYKTGGLAYNPSVVGIGEAGPEAILPLESNKTMGMIADSILDNYSGGIDEDMIANAVAEGVVMAIVSNQQNFESDQRPINITVKLENDEAIARAAIRGQQSIDYRMNPTPQFG